MSVHIKGIGKGLPLKRVTNDELAATIDTSDEWIRSHTGIGSRYVCGEGETSATLGADACKAALADAAKNGYTVSATDIDVIICATAAAEHWSFPSNACLIQKALGATNAAAFDISAACSGFIYGLQVARGLMHQMRYKNALVIGAECLSRIVDNTDRSTCVLFGDGAGAALLVRTDGSGGNSTDCGDCATGCDDGGAPVESSDSADGFGSFILGADGTGAESLYLGADDLHIHMDGRAVYNFAVAKQTEIIKELMQKDSLCIDDVDLIVCHQANERIIQAAAKRLGYPMDKFVLTLKKYANTSSSSIPIALADLNESGVLKKGMTLLLAGFGAGLTWGGCVIKW